MINVIQRSGETRPLDITKIRRVVEWACEGLEVNPLALESGLTSRLRDGITTREIQENLINVATQLFCVEETDWKYVAGRLHIWGLWKDTRIKREFGGYLSRTVFKRLEGTDYAKYVQWQVERGVYDSKIAEIYDEKDLEIAGEWIYPEYDKDFDYAGAIMLSERYLLDCELPQEAFLTCALLLASVEEKPENRLRIAYEIYQAIAQRKISLATPILGNLRTPNGSLSSCFIVAIEDNLESIFSEITNTARISKNGGGVGVNVSRIRATGSSVMGKANASGGVIPWIKLLNDTAIAVNQGGRRAGAVTVGVDIWHLDVPEFLEMQTENGDQRRKAYDVFPQLVIPDEFMRRVITKDEWTLVDPYEVRTKLGIELAELWGEKFETAYKLIEDSLGTKITLYKKVNARELFKNVMRPQIETGMPYLAFKDTINRANPNKHDGYIPQVNLCCESFSNVTPGKTAHCCNLVSLNLANIDTLINLLEMCRLAVRILDNTIDLTYPPIGEAKEHNDLYRTIGVGVMGLADWLAKRKLSYKSFAFISDLFENISYFCTLTSMELAKERGSYQACFGSKWSQGKLLGAKSLEWFQSNSHHFYRWQRLASDVQRYGIRNSHITAIAPNTTSSLIQGCTASVLPVFKRVFTEKNSKGAIPNCPPFIKESFWYYQENQNLDQKIVVQAIAEMQKWIDTGISMELLFNLNQGIYFPDEPNRGLTAKEIYETLILAWESGCKAVYYVRTVQKDNFKDNCSSCAN
ncbi:ribonucleoside-diphosphate reductase [uncultured phage]|nr:ribonucleoside-diphosphate reductase [uncultured phage]